MAARLQKERKKEEQEKEREVGALPQEARKKCHYHRGCSLQRSSP